MSLWRAVLPALLVCLPLLSAPKIPLEEYKQRREALRKALSDSVIILFGRTERDGGEIRSGFYQDPNFYYLTGWPEPGAILVMTPAGETLLLPRRDKVQEQWTGPKAAPGDSDLAAHTGFKEVLTAESFESNLPKWLEAGKNVFTLLDSQGENLRRMLPMRDVRSASQAIARLRMKKSDAELAMIQHSTDAGVEAHKAAWKRIKPGIQEYEVAAAMTSVYFNRGCERHAYSPIVGSGGNAAVLHYNRNNRRMDSGELLLMDVGPECSMYAADITRTVPVNGKFTPRQRELYEVVLGAQKAALAAIKPGVMFGNRTNPIGLHKVAADYIDSHGKDKKGGSLGKYFIHGLGHHVGLDVHDAFDPGKPLEAGMVITIEPGVYLPDEGIGVRIEDMVLVTEDGAKLLSSGLPRQIDEIERFMASK